MPPIVPVTLDSAETRRATRPFLKWAGGKRQLLRELRRFVPETFDSYFEPFLGSGALFFDLWNAGALEGKRVALIDSNRDVAGCYGALARDVDGVIAALGTLAAGHLKDPSAHFYDVRDERFNPSRRAIASDPGREYPVDLAAMFIYLNRTGFNGLYRLNAKGDFNVPAGRYAAPHVCDERTLRAVAEALRSPAVVVKQDGFESVRASAEPGDFVYFDPPYAPLNATARFTSYTAAGFSDEDQRRLRDVVVELAARGCHVVVSNSTAPLIKALYADDPQARAAGLCAHRVAARRSINSDPAGRAEIAEYIISNVRPRARRV